MLQISVNFLHDLLHKVSEIPYVTHKSAAQANPFQESLTGVQDLCLWGQQDHAHCLSAAWKVQQ